MNDTYFVQLGMKRNGRIVKNEQFDLNVIVDKFEDSVYCIELPWVAPEEVWKPFKISFWDFITGKYKDHMISNNKCVYREGVRASYGAIIKEVKQIEKVIKFEIDSDEFGRKKK